MSELSHQENKANVIIEANEAKFANHTVTREKFLHDGQEVWGTFIETTPETGFNLLYDASFITQGIQKEPGGLLIDQTATAQSTHSIMLYFTDAQSPYDHYDLEYGTGSNSYQYASGDFGSVGTRTYLVDSLAPGTTYYFRVRAGNGCATGPWSNEISATTNGGINTLLTSTTGNNGGGSLAESPVSAPSAQITPSIPTPKPTPVPTGVTLAIKVVNKNNQPVEGAKVTIHSIPQTTTTDRNGIAKFTNVENGHHSLLIAYNGQQATQQLNVEAHQDNPIDLTVHLTSQNPLLTFPSLVVGGVLILVVLVLGFMLYRARKSSKK